MAPSIVAFTTEFWIIPGRNRRYFRMAEIMDFVEAARILFGSSGYGGNRWGALGAHFNGAVSDSARK